MQAVTGFLANYSANFKMALLIWPVLSFMLTMPILAWLYHRDGRVRASSAFGTYLAILYALGIVCFTLYPLPEGSKGPGITYGISPNLIPFHFLADIAKDGLKAVFQVAFNVAFFVPLGFIAGRLFRMRMVSALCLAFGVSLAVETAQLTGLFGIYPYAYRCFDVDDLLCNTVGGVLGWFAAQALGRVMPERMDEVSITHQPGLVRRCVALWLDMLIIWLAAVAAGLVWLVVAVGFELAWDEPLRVGGWDAAQVSGLLAFCGGLVACVVVEVVIPWMHEGCTPGGSFVRMSFEGHVRTSGWRVAFYACRVLTLLALFGLPFFAVPALLIFYVIKRCMPYDLIP